LGEKHLLIPAQMIAAGSGDVRALPGFGEEEGALDDGLGVECEAPGSPLRLID